MAAPRPSRPSTSPTQKPVEKARVSEARAEVAKDRPIQRPENTDHPRFGNDWRYYVNLVVTDFHNRHSWKNTLRLAKAWSHFMQAALGVGKLPRLRVDILPEPGDAPDIAENGPDLSKQVAQTTDRQVSGGLSTYNAAPSATA